MTKKTGRKNQNRSPKPVVVREDRLGPVVPAKTDKYVSLDRGPIHSIAKVTSTQRNYTRDSVIANFLPLEDTVLPVELKFRAPLRDLTTEPRGFDYHWQRLTYLFDLDDPQQFPTLADYIPQQERSAVVRYVQTCRALARYSILSGKGGFKMNSSGNENWTVDGTLPTHEAFAGFSATFRQIHNDKEKAGFTVVWNIVNKACASYSGSEHEVDEMRTVLKRWKKARWQLNQKMAATLLCEKVLGEVEPGMPISFEGIVPDDVIKAYNYGDSLHWGDEVESLAGMSDDQYNTIYHKHACVVSMIQLSHIYFGFSDLMSAALGNARTSLRDR